MATSQPDAQRPRHRRTRRAAVIRAGQLRGLVLAARSGRIPRLRQPATSRAPVRRLRSSATPDPRRFLGQRRLYFYVGKRVSHHLDAEFAGRVLLPADLAIEIEVEEPIYFDTDFNPIFALVHENYQRDAVPVDLGVNHIDLRLLAPVDLAVSKIARFADVDREDIASLVQAGLTAAAAIAQRAREAVTA